MSSFSCYSFLCFFLSLFLFYDSRVLDFHLFVLFHFGGLFRFFFFRIAVVGVVVFCFVFVLLLLFTLLVSVVEELVS